MMYHGSPSLVVQGLVASVAAWVACRLLRASKSTSLRIDVALIGQSPVVRIPPLGGRPHGFLSSRIRLVAECGIVEKAQRHQRATLQKHIRRAQSRVSAADRKRRTRRLILMGSYLEHVTGNDPDKRDRLIKGLDVFLERDRDRELFELAPNKEISDGNPD